MLRNKMRNFQRSELEPNLFKLSRLISEIERLEFEFKFYNVTNSIAEKERIEMQLGTCYSILMKSAQKDNLKNISTDAENYVITLSHS